MGQHQQPTLPHGESCAVRWDALSSSVKDAREEWRRKIPVFVHEAQVIATEEAAILSRDRSVDHPVRFLWQCFVDSVHDWLLTVYRGSDAERSRVWCLLDPLLRQEIVPSAWSSTIHPVDRPPWAKDPRVLMYGEIPGSMWWYHTTVEDAQTKAQAIRREVPRGSDLHKLLKLIPVDQRYDIAYYLDRDPDRWGTEGWGKADKDRAWRELPHGISLDSDLGNQLWSLRLAHSPFSEVDRTTVLFVLRNASPAVLQSLRGGGQQPPTTTTKDDNNMRRFLSLIPPAWSFPSASSSPSTNTTYNNKVVAATTIEAPKPSPPLNTLQWSTTNNFTAGDGTSTSVPPRLVAPLLPAHLYYLVEETSKTKWNFLTKIDTRGSWTHHTIQPDGTSALTWMVRKMVQCTQHDPERFFTNETKQNGRMGIWNQPWEHSYRDPTTGEIVLLAGVFAYERYYDKFGWVHMYHPLFRFCQIDANKKEYRIIFYLLNGDVRKFDGRPFEDVFVEKANLRMYRSMQDMKETFTTTSWPTRNVAWTQADMRTFLLASNVSIMAPKI